MGQLTTDWLMVIITAIYVIATIAIWRANMQSANATKAQLAESEREYEEKKRLEMMPCFDIEVNKWTEAGPGICIELTDKSTGIVASLFYKVCIDNVSNGLALNVKCITSTSVLGEKEMVIFPIIPAHGNRIVNTLFLADEGYLEKEGLPISFLMSYDDILNNHYTQKIELRLIRDTHKFLLIDRINAPRLQ